MSIPEGLQNERTRKFPLDSGVVNNFTTSNNNRENVEDENSENDSLDWLQDCDEGIQFYQYNGNDWKRDYGI